MIFSISRCARHAPRLETSRSRPNVLCSDALGGVPEVLEQFLFDFSFSSNGATMNVSTKSRGAAGKAAIAASVEASTLAGLRKQACGIVRARACSCAWPAN